MPVAKSLRSRFISGSAFVFSSRVITTLTALGSQAFLARLLPVSDYGSFVLISSLVAIAGTLSSLGLRPTLVREVSKAMAQGRPADARKVVVLGLGWGCLGSLAAAMVLNFGLGSWIANSIWKDPSLSSLMALVGLWIVATGLQSLISEAYRGFQDFHRASLYGGPVSGLLLVAILGPAFFLGSHISLGAAVALACFTVLASALFPLPFLAASLGRLRGRGGISAKSLLNQAWPALTATLAGFLVSQADLWCLGAFRGKEEVALYGSAQRLAVLISMSLMIVGGVLPPMIAELHAKGEKRRLEKALRKVAGVSGWTALALYALFFTGGPWLLSALYGDFYGGAWKALAILGLGQLANVLTGSCGYTLLMTGHQRAFMNLTLAVGLASVSVMAALAPRFGTLAVAPAAAAGTALLNILLWLYAKKKVGVWTHASWLPPYSNS